MVGGRGAYFFSISQDHFHLRHVLTKRATNMVILAMHIASNRAADCHKAGSRRHR